MAEVKPVRILQKQFLSYSTNIVCVCVFGEEDVLSHAHPPYSNPASVNRVKYSLWLGNGL